MIAKRGGWAAWVAAKAGVASGDVAVGARLPLGSCRRGLVALFGVAVCLPVHAAPLSSLSAVRCAVPAPVQATVPPGPAWAARDIPAEAAPRVWLTSGAGEAGEGEEGPAFDAARAKDDPVVYLTAVEVAAAHYHAGRAAYAAGRQEEGAEMFAHGISEVYVDLKPALLAQGLADFQPLMDKAVELASAKAPPAEVDAAAVRVLEALQAAAGRPPASDLSAADIRRQVLAEVMNRAAHNYMIAARGVSRDAYLDGYGYRVAAEQRAPGVLADLAPGSTEAADKIGQAVAALAKGYASIEKPATGDIAPGDLLVAVSKALLAAGPS